MRNSTNQCKMFIRKLTFSCLIVFEFYLFLQTSTASAYSRSPSHYDPEQQDGIPVLSARSSEPKLTDEWLNHDDERLQAVQLRKTQRRNSDADLDDGLEEEDDDEYQSGSSNHEQIEPSYGESRRAARDGDEIENFFDKHLGPPQDTGESQDTTSEVPISRLTGDPEDDMYAAGSSPLSSIFHSLLNGHRPFVIHATKDTSDSSSDVDQAEQQSQASGGTQQDSSLSPSNPIGSSSSIRGQSMSSGHYVQPVSPAAFLMPLATPSSMTSYDTPQPNDGEDNHDQQTPFREIYIGRRPVVASYLQQTYASQPTVPMITAGVQSAGSAQVFRGIPAASRPQSLSDHDESSIDYSRYPAAASYAHQREHPNANDEEQTVTYGLSFGGRQFEGADEPTSPEAQMGHQEEPSPNGYDGGEQQHQHAYVPYNTRELMRYKTSSSRAHNNYQNSYPASGYVRVPQHHQAFMMHQRQQAPYHVSRYHRNPSEATVATIRPTAGHHYHPRAGHYRGADNKAAAMAASMERQQLLASFDRQIKASPYYRQQVFSRPAKETMASQTIKNGILSSNDLDIYDSYHSEVDPFKTVTATSKMIRYPSVLDTSGPVESGSNRIPANADVSEQVGDNVSRHYQQNGSGQQNSLPSSSNGNNNNQNDNKLNERSITSSSLSGNNDNNRHQTNDGLLTGPIVNYDSQNLSNSQEIDLARSNNDNNRQANLRVRRDDSDERESDADDDDGVWVDDDEDDDNRQQSSDVNETSQEPEEDENQEQEVTHNHNQMAHINPPGVIGGPHGYELSPNDLMIYHG